MKKGKRTSRTPAPRRGRKTVKVHYRGGYVA